MGPRLSVCKNLEEVFQGYVDQVKKSEDKDLKKEREKHGPDYTPQSKAFQKGDAKIFNLNDKDSDVRENVHQDIAKNLIHQDNRFGNFEKKILYLDCNNLYGMYLYLIPCILIITMCIHQDQSKLSPYH